MAAFTCLADGTVLRWHAAPTFTECRHADCPEPHATMAELGDFTGAER